MATYRLTVAALSLLCLVSTAGAETTLAPKFQEGATYKSKETTKTRQSLKLGGQTIDTAADTVVVSQTKIGKRNEQGDLTMEVTYTDVTSTVTLPDNKKVTYNSATGEGTSDDPNYQIILERLQAIKGLTCTVTLDKDNQVKSVAGLKPDAGVSPDDIKMTMQQMFARYPQEPVEAGETWKREITVPLGEGQIFTLQRTYKYVGPEVRSTVDSTRRLEKVTATTEKIEYSIKPNAGIPGTVTKSDLKANTGETTLLFDPELGRTLETVDKMHITGSLTLAIMGLELAGELDLTMERKSEEVK